MSGSKELPTVMISTNIREVVNHLKPSKNLKMIHIDNNQ